jgi:HemK-like putative methylase
VSSPVRAPRIARARRASSQTVGGLLDKMTRIIANVSDHAEAAADAREILAYLMDVTRSWPAFNADATVSPETVSQALAAAEKRSHGAPIQYCAGLAAFRQLTLKVDGRVLIPRPETELLVEHVLSRVNSGTAFDICTGSGAIVLALATEGSFESLFATDISDEALQVARSNVERFEGSLKPRLELLSGSGLAPLAGSGRMSLFPIRRISRFLSCSRWMSPCANGNPRSPCWPATTEWL